MEFWATQIFWLFYFDFKNIGEDEISFATAKQSAKR